MCADKESLLESSSSLSPKFMPSCFDINRDISESGNKSIIYMERKECTNYITSPHIMEPLPTGTTTNNRNVYVLGDYKQRIYIL